METRDRLREVCGDRASFSDSDVASKRVCRAEHTPRMFLLSRVHDQPPYD